MADLITHVANRLALKAEAQAIARDSEHPLNRLFRIDEDGKIEFNTVKIPIQYSNDKGASLCLCRGLSREQLALASSIDVLGECINNQYVFDSAETQSVYESIYDTKPRMIDDGEGGQVEYTPSYLMGVFA